MISRFKLGELGLWLILLWGCAGMAWADPPARVGRLNYLDGTVSFTPSGVDQWVPATLNYPLTTGDHLWTDAGARAEMHIGSTAVRLDQSTELDIPNLDDHTVQLRLPQGTLSASLQHFSPDSCGRNAGYPAPPARTRTCSFPASGSSVVLAFA